MSKWQTNRNPPEPGFYDVTVQLERIPGKTVRMIASGHWSGKKHQRWAITDTGLFDDGRVVAWRPRHKTYEGPAGFFGPIHKLY